MAYAQAFSRSWRTMNTFPGKRFCSCKWVCPCRYTVTFLRLVVPSKMKQAPNTERCICGFNLIATPRTINGRGRLFPCPRLRVKVNYRRKKSGAKFKQIFQDFPILLGALFLKAVKRTHIGSVVLHNRQEGGQREICSEREMHIPENKGRGVTQIYGRNA